MRSLTLAFILVSSLLTISNSYAQHNTCGSDKLHQEQLENNPQYRLEMENFEEYLQSPRFTMRQQHTIGGVTVYRIPVVFHVMHKGEAIGVGTNVSKTAILNSIQALNSRYRKLAGGIGDGNGVDIEIEFSLAVRDPYGNCTDGIVRYDMTGNTAYMNFGINSNNTTGMDDDVLKALSFWDSYKYYNIWVVSEIDDNNGGSGTQGYAYFASSHGQSYDGAVMIPNSITDTVSVTLPHEIGHALNLYHTFEGDVNGTTCPPNAVCTTDGDKVCDTPPHIRSPFICSAGTNACDGGSNNSLFYNNYMDYSADYCQNMFTAGQKTRMVAALTTTRASLLAENGNLSLVPPTTATVDFTASKTVVCTGGTVQLFDLSSCTPNTFTKSIGWPGISFSWTVTNNAGTTLNFTTQNPLFVMSVAGTYDVTLSVTNPSGTTSTTKQGLLIVKSAAVAAVCNPVNSSPPTGNTGYGIYGVYLNTIAFTSDNTYYDIVSGVTNAQGYGDFSCTQTTILKANTTYSFGLQGTPYNVLTEDFKVFIDYTNDGDFLDAGEQIIFINNRVGGAGLVYTTFTTLAAPVMDTPLRMRVISGTSTESLTSCSNTVAGQIEDYSVIISSKYASVTIAAAPSTTITYGTSVTFTATPVNGGTTPAYKWYLNGVLQGSTTATFSSSTLNNGDQVYCVMTSNLSGVVASPATSNTLTMVVTGVPQSDFTQNKTNVCVGGTVVYTDKSKQTPTSWAWTFAGGTPGTSTAQNPSVVYNTTGTYNTTLIASNGSGTGTTKTQANLIQAYSVIAAPFTAFSARTGGGAPTGNIGITHVLLNTINEFTPYDDAVYIDNYCTIITTLTAGSTYAMDVAGSNINPQRLSVYIDYNADGAYTSAERIFGSTTAVASFNSFTFTVPTTATVGKLLRMRVITDYGDGTALAYNSNPLSYGQVEDYGIAINSNSLPISLLSFTANRIGVAQASINWELAGYSDVHGFYIERSVDGNRYEAIDSLLPTNSSSGRVSYSVTDPNAPESVTYYRLRTIYTDGSSEYSKTVTLSEAISPSSSVYAYPIPVTQDEVKIYYGNTSGDIQWTLSDVDGRTLSSGVLHTADHADVIHFSNIPNSVYILRMVTQNKTYTQRITILK